MNNITVTDNSILCSRKGELVRISACGENAIRFQEQYYDTEVEVL